MAASGKFKHSQAFRHGSGLPAGIRLLLWLFMLGAPVHGCVDDIAHPTMEEFKACNQGIKYSDKDVDMDTYQTPTNFDFDTIVSNLTTGTGYFFIRQAFSRRDIEMALNLVLNDTPNPFDREEEIELPQNDELHNNYRGMRWNLLKKGKIFQKLIQHPDVLSVMTHLMGDQSIVSSYASNTILPGMKGQKPHLDYPYYRHIQPEGERKMVFPYPMSLQFVICLTKFSSKNGGTAIMPDSHHVPSYPDDVEYFNKHMMQVECQPGDIAAFAGPMQHGAMPNLSKHIRSGILMHYAPVYVKPFEEIVVTEQIKKEASPALRKLLALDFPYPTLKD